MRQVARCVLALLGLTVLCYSLLAHSGTIALLSRGGGGALLDTTHSNGFVQKTLSQVRSGLGRCVPRNNVMFLKTHKCASSTIENILLRYAKFHNQTISARGQGRVVAPGNSRGGPIIVATPATGNYFGSPEKFKAAMLKKAMRQGRVNMFTAHCRLNVVQHRQILPPDALWVTAFRDPTSLYPSLFSYYNLQNHMGKTLQDFLTLPLEKMKKLPRYHRRLGANQMTFDLGYDPDVFYNDTKIDEMIAEVEETFDLVLVTDRLDEGLVLLGHLLCWSTDDLLALRKNTHMKTVEITGEGRQKLTALNHADHRLYQHFAGKFELLTQLYGKEKLQQEVKQLQRQRDALVEYCGAQAVSARSSQAVVREHSEKVMSFSLKQPNDATCLALVWNSKDYLQYFYKVQ